MTEYKIKHYNSNDEEVHFSDPDVQYSIIGNLKINRGGSKFLWIENESNYVNLMEILKFK
jgi:hypothetical protein